MPKPSKFAANLAAEDPEKTELRKSLRKAHDDLAKAKRKTEDVVAATYAAARDAALAYGVPKIPAKPARHSVRGGKEEQALIHTTDWQVGKITSSYNSDVAIHRLSVELPDKLDRVTDIQRAAHPVNVAHVMFGGDMVEGVTIFPGQAFGIDATLFDQLFCTVDICAKIILRALKTFQYVEVWTEKGNHGRLGKKGEVPAGDNVDLIVYEIVRRMFAGESRVRWHNADAPGIWNMVTIGNYKALLFHGDEVKSFGGNIPAFGITRKITKWNAGVAPPFADAYGGHYHTHMELGLPSGHMIYMTGSPESGNEFAMEFMAETGDPSQRLHFIEPERGRVTAQYRIWLEHGL